MNEKFELMHGLADGELSGEEKARAEELRQSDPDCKKEWLWAQAICEIVRNKAVKVDCEESWKSSVARLDALDKSKTAERIVTKYAWAFCTILLVGIMTAGFKNRFDQNSTISSSQVASIFDPISSRSSQMNSVDLEAAKKVSLASFEVRANHAGILDSRQYVYFSLHDGLGGLGLAVVAGAYSFENVSDSTGVRGFRAGKVNDANCISWNLQGDTFLLAGNRSHKELVEIAQQMITK